MFSFVNTINLSLLQVKGRSDLFLKLEIAKKAVSIIMILLSAPWGIMAMCWSIVIYTQIAILLIRIIQEDFFIWDIGNSWLIFFHISY